MRFGEAGLLKFKELLNSTGQRQAVSVGGNFIWTQPDNFKFISI